MSREAAGASVPLASRSKRARRITEKGLKVGDPADCPKDSSRAQVHFVSMSTSSKRKLDYCSAAAFLKYIPPRRPHFLSHLLFHGYGAIEHNVDGGSLAQFHLFAAR